MATTCKSVSTKSPFDFVWRIVIIVEAGAVAEARAAKTSENAKSIPITKCIKIKVKTDEVKASKSVRTTTFKPFFLIVESLKNSPTLKAIKARAIFEIKLNDCKILTLPAPTVVPFGISLRQYGPKITPVKM